MGRPPQYESCFADRRGRFQKNRWARLQALHLVDQALPSLGLVRRTG
jgi:hypothetical protein